MARILVVEDDDDLRSTVSDLLTAHGFDVSEASNGLAALQCMLSMSDPSLVILDLEMPVMSGTELLKLMDSYHRLSLLPVLILSAGAQAALPRHAAIVGVMLKPFDARAFIETVKNHVRKSSGTRSPMEGFGD